MLKSGNTLDQIGTLPDWVNSLRNPRIDNSSARKGWNRMLQWVSGKVEYTEEEAASALGISIGQLRSLVRTHLIKEEMGMEVPIPTFRPTDLLLLKMLSDSQPRLASTVES